GASRSRCAQSLVCSELGDCGVAQHQALGAVRRLELHLDLGLVPLPGDLGDRPHPEGVMGDPITCHELGQLLRRGRLAARAEARSLDVAAPAADAAAEGGSALGAGAAASAVAARAAVAPAESGTAEGGPGTGDVEHLSRDLV